MCSGNGVMRSTVNTFEILFLLLIPGQPKKKSKIAVLSNGDCHPDVAALLKCFVAEASIAEVEGSKYQVPLPTRVLLVKSNVK